MEDNLYDETIDDIETLRKIPPIPIKYVLPHTDDEIKNNGWNNTLEHLLQQWGEQSKGFQWMYAKTSRKYDRSNRILGFSSIALGSTAGTLSFINLLFDGTAITIFAGLAGYIASMFGAMYQFLKLEKRSRNYKMSAIKYQNLATDIEYQLGLLRRNRAEGRHYMKEVKMLIDRYKAECPPIPDDITFLFNKTFGEQNISKPDIAGEISKIIIKRNDSSASSSSSSDDSITPPKIVDNNCTNSEIVIQIENDNPSTLEKTAQMLANQLNIKPQLPFRRRTKKRKKSSPPPKQAPNQESNNEDDGYATA